MEIKLKYNIGDEVFFLDYFNMKIERGKIEHIELVIFENMTVVWYSVIRIMNDEEPADKFEAFTKNFNNIAVKLKEEMLFKNRKITE